MDRIIAKQDLENLRNKSIKEIVIKRTNPLDEYKKAKIKVALDDSPKVLTMRRTKNIKLF